MSFSKRAMPATQHHHQQQQLLQKPCNPRAPIVNGQPTSASTFYKSKARYFPGQAIRPRPAIPSELSSNGPFLQTEWHKENQHNPVNPTRITSTNAMFETASRDSHPITFGRRTSKIGSDNFTVHNKTALMHSHLPVDRVDWPHFHSHSHSSPHIPTVARQLADSAHDTSRDSHPITFGRRTSKIGSDNFTVHNKTALMHSHLPVDRVDWPHFHSHSHSSPHIPTAARQLADSAHDRQWLDSRLAADDLAYLFPSQNSQDTTHGSQSGKPSACLIRRTAGGDVASRLHPTVTSRTDWASKYLKS
ncbi:hypothetical protein AHF37_06095 [Paragonimus kellicotti]|nr:hypothetical protein AHF37_06095 [Paragonimus kellicotti]